MKRLKSKYQSIQQSRLYRLATEGCWFLAGNIATILGSLALVRVLTERLDAGQYGQLALGLTITGLVNQMITGGLAVGIGRFYSVAAERDDLIGYVSGSRRILKNGTIAVALLGLCLISGLYCLGYTQWLGMAAAALVLSLFSGYNSALNSIQSAARQRAIVAFHGGTDAWLKIAIAVAVMLWLGQTSTAVVIGFACSSLLITTSQFLFLRKTIYLDKSIAPDGHYWQGQIWRYSLPFCTFGLFTWIQQASDRWALSFFSTEEEVGKYAVLFQVGYAPIAVATGALTSFLVPIFYRRAGDATDKSRNMNNHRVAWRITQFSLLATMVAVLSAFSLHKMLFAILVPTKYQGVSYLLPWALLAGGLFAAGQMLSLKLMSEMKSSKLTKIKIITAVLGTLCNIVGAAYMGTRGVVAGLVVFSVIYFAWMAVLGRRCLINNTGTSTKLRYTILQDISSG
jgi:O-antigen/teichoic acid export membrane protein